MSLIYYKEFFQEAKLQGLHCDLFEHFEGLNVLETFEADFKSYFPPLMTNLIINQDLIQAPPLLNADSSWLAFTAAFILKNPKP